MSVSLFSLSLALTVGQDAGFASPQILLAFAVSAVTAVVFVVVELRIDSPMLELRLFKTPMLTVGVVTGVLVFVCLSATFILLPFYLAGVLGFDVFTMGLLLGVAPVMMGILSPMSGTLSDRIGIRRLTLVGLTIISLTYFGFLTLNTESTGLHFVALAIPTGSGLAYSSPRTTAPSWAVSHPSTWAWQVASSTSPDFLVRLWASRSSGRSGLRGSQPLAVVLSQTAEPRLPIRWHRSPGCTLYSSSQSGSWFWRL